MHKPRTKCRKLFSGVGQIGESSPFWFLRKKKRAKPRRVLAFISNRRRGSRSDEYICAAGD